MGPAEAASPNFHLLKIRIEREKNVWMTPSMNLSSMNLAQTWCGVIIKTEDIPIIFYISLL